MKRLVRVREDRMVAGVATGLAAHLDVDPMLVRLAFAGLCIFGGAGVVIYAAGWLLMPEEPREGESAPIPALIPRDPVAGVGVALVSLGVVALLRTLIPWVADRPVWPLALIGLGALLLLGRK